MSESLRWLAEVTRAALEATGIALIAIGGLVTIVMLVLAAFHGRVRVTSASHLSDSDISRCGRRPV